MQILLPLPPVAGDPSTADIDAISWRLYDMEDREQIREQILARRGH